MFQCFSQRPVAFPRHSNPKAACGQMCCQSVVCSLRGARVACTTRTHRDVLLAACVAIHLDVHQVCPSGRPRIVFDTSCSVDDVLGVLVVVMPVQGGCTMRLLQRNQSACVCVCVCSYRHFEHIVRPLNLAPRAWQNLQLARSGLGMTS